jgi:steroid delta-isomerase-like uncharacterized protein
MSSVDHIQLIERSLSAWKQQDESYITEVFHESLVYEDVPLRKIMNGTAAFREFFRVNTVAFPDLDMTLLMAVADTEAGGAEWTLTGTFLGETPELGRPTGRQFNIRGASIFRFKENRILTVTDYFDGQSFTSQLGVQEG